MKIANIFKYPILFSLTIGVISCSQSNSTKESPQVRFVNLQGESKKIRLSTPTDNITALNKQGKISQTKIIEESNYKAQNAEPKNLSFNKYGNNQPGKLNDPSKENGLIYTMNLPTEKNNQENIEKPASRDDKKTEETNSKIEEKEYELTKSSTKRVSNSGARIISETKFPAKSKAKSRKSSKLKSGSYVQAGSFANKNHAKQHLQKIEKLTNNLQNINLQSAKVRNKNYYRVVIGPITKKETANLIIKNLKRQGQNSIIIKIK